ncbi:MAG: putative toxin-antitoxin system toxin component, PIN family [Saprospiraceae bacterium]|nr:MAG: putative toxin-antitoxin system toxin component, PIN family [Saprospiraceae bacterium]
MKVVLDTNVLLVSISRRSKYHPIFEAFENKHYQLLVTTDILSEYDETIGYHMGAGTSDNVLNGFHQVSNVTFITKYFYWNLITADPDDDKFVDCAVAGNADFIVSDDNYFKVLKDIPFPKIKVISADDFLEMLNSQRQ